LCGQAACGIVIDLADIVKGVAVAIGQAAFYAFLGWLGLGVILSAIGAIAGLHRRGTRGRVEFALAAVLFAAFGALLVAINPLSDGTYRAAWYILVFGGLMPIVTAWEIVQYRRAQAAVAR
jgi:hypothetical protein